MVQEFVALMLSLEIGEYIGLNLLILILDYLVFLYLQQQSNMLMNINDDDCCDMEDYTSAYDAMDGEGAVDYSQYGITTQASSSRVTSFQHEGYCL